jgi:hypothetical protein
MKGIMEVMFLWVDDSITRIIGLGKVNLRLIDGRIRKLLGVVHI